MNENDRRGGFSPTPLRQMPAQQRAFGFGTLFPALALAVMFGVTTATATVRGQGPDPVQPPPPGLDPARDLVQESDILDKNSDWSAKKLKSAGAEVLGKARAITAPVDRSLALVRVGLSKIFNNELEIAHDAFFEAGQSALMVEDKVFRDLRTMSVIRGMMDLTQALRREGMSQSSDDAKGKAQRKSFLNLILKVGQEARELAGRLGPIGNRCEMRYLIAEEISRRAYDIYNQVNLPSELQGDVKGQKDELQGVAQNLLKFSADIGAEIERPVWRDRCLVTVVMNAGASRQFELGAQIARTIPAPEIRAEALGRLGDALARSSKAKDDERARFATRMFQESAQSIAMIPLPDPRDDLAELLIEVLVALGRFDDARASAVLMTDVSRHTLSLAGIAESQGKRGRGKDARAWIAQLSDPNLRSTLERKVVEGELVAIDQNRSQSQIEDSLGPADNSAVSPATPKTDADPGAGADGVTDPKPQP